MVQSVGLLDAACDQALYRRAQALERLGRVDEALSAFKALVSDVPAAKGSLAVSRGAFGVGASREIAVAGGSA